MKLLVIGQGGREHAIAWKLAQSPLAAHVFVAPGNAGTALDDNMSNVAIAATDTQALLHFAQDHDIEMTIVGPETPLAAGIVDLFQQHRIPCFGPTQQACQLESSKQFCKDFLVRHQIPTPHYQCFTHIEPALAYANDHPLPMVIKADGLAAGKGVIIANTLKEAHHAIIDMLQHHRFGDAGARIIIEQFLIGEELSYIIMTDGTHCLPLASSQDHKRRDDNDQGPNTGGMGAYSPAPRLTPELEQTLLSTIIQPTVQGMAQEGHRYVGFLYAGLMMTDNGDCYVLEFNCRLGDPETQPLLMRLQSDLLPLCQHALAGTLDTTHADWNAMPAISVVMAAEGYPNPARRGDSIHCPALVDNRTKIFHAGTRLMDNILQTDGGRVLSVTAMGETLQQAQQQAYRIAKTISWNGCFYRSDIGYRALNNHDKKPL